MEQLDAPWSRSIAICPSTETQREKMGIWLSNKRKRRGCISFPLQEGRFVVSLENSLSGILSEQRQLRIMLA